MSNLTPDETILGLLAAHPQHGYQLLETFNHPDHLGNVWSLSTSQLYAVLKRLERNGWIHGHSTLSDNAPTRTEYTLTPSGKEVLHLWLNEPHPSASIRRVRVEFLSRLYIAQRLGIPALSIVRHQRLACEHERSRMVTQPASPHSIGGLASRFVVAQLDALLQWLQDIEATFTPEAEASG
jgi:PadR family transcriptional regulator, regulatory protein AphA